ncbi:hypothetical protein EK21DRAFT_107641 [Setomelanomma holmii]|uniref:DUF7730 domain-containing protein n=1 Tax=Setomelanomma holmii TaxID=210430 RepID=A0A9P4LTS3_9PLEO|nr:hypothetical protein EK21DRAFT_107641 [Setomelanomma holmii]
MATRKLRSKEELQRAVKANPELSQTELLGADIPTSTFEAMAAGLLSAADFVDLGLAKWAKVLHEPSLKDEVIEDSPDAIPLPPPPKLENFLKLPREIRTNVYEMAIYTGQPIRPHLCDEAASTFGAPDGINFHDQCQHSRVKPNHSAISNFLGITRVSKEVRAEALPCFYSNNEFKIDQDTAIYFMRLQQLGRFHMLRHIRFGIDLHREEWTAQI